jgi:TolB-like protein
MIPITVIVTIPIMLMEANQNEGYVEIIDVQLTDTISGGVLWSGSFSKKMEMKYADVYPARAASEILKEIANEIVKQIESINIK